MENQHLSKAVKDTNSNIVPVKGKVDRKFNNENNGTGELRNNGLVKLGSSNTKLIPVMPDGYTYNTEVVESEVRVFCDYLKFWGEGLSLSLRHVDYLVNEILVGELWKTATMYNLGLEPMVVNKIDCGGQTRNGSRQSWSYRYENSLGVKLWVSISRHDENVIDTIALEFSGEPLALLIPRNNFLKVGELCDLVLSLDPKIKCTRCDTTLEFGHELLDFKEIIIAVNSGNYAGCRKAQVIYEHHLGKGIQYPTVYLGSKTSDKRVRIYETTEKHGYEGIRIEIQNRDKYAQSVIAYMVNAYQGAMNNCMDAKQKRLTGKCGIIEENSRVEGAKTDFNKSIKEFFKNWNLSPRTFNFVHAESKSRWKTCDQFLELPFWKKFKESLRVARYRYTFAPIKVQVQKSIKWFMEKAIGLYRVLSSHLGGAIADHVLMYMVKANEEKYQGGYSDRNAVLMKQLKDLGQGVLFKMFDENERSILSDLGMFERMPRKFKFKNSVLDFQEFLRNPQDYQESMSF